MPYHPADRNKIYGTPAEKLLKMYRDGLIKKGGMNFDEASERMIEMRRSTNNYNELFVKLIGYL